MMNFVCFDTEDDSKELFEQDRSLCIAYHKTVTQIAACDNRGRHFYSGPDKADVPKFLEWLREIANRHKWDTLIVYAHNLQYDLGNLFRDKLDVLDVVLVGGRLIRATWYNIEFRDSYNIWPMSVKKLGPAFSLSKGELDPHSREYVWQDVNIIHRAMTFAWEMAKEHGIEILPTTLGGFAVKLWKALGGENWQESSDFTRAAFFGGRVELFCEGGSGDIEHCDINSLYPWAMTFDFPTEAQFCYDIPVYGVAEVTIDVPEMFIAPLPVRRADGAIIFPVGRLHGIWTTPEIMHAVTMGAKLQQLHRAVGSDTSCNYYAPFVEWCYSERLKETSGTAKHLMFKLLMNNLYGQLGVTGQITRSLYLTEDDFAEQEVDGIPYGTKKLAEYSIPLPPCSNYLHAALVTGYGRVHLMKFLSKVEPTNLIYCDTDSVIHFGKAPWPISNKLGMMKLEAKASHCRVICPKTYIVDGVAKAKGVKRDLAADYIAHGSVEFEQPFRFREAVTYYDDGNKRALSVWHKVRKDLRRTYDKKKLKKNRFWPLHLQKDKIRCELSL